MKKRFILVLALVALVSLLFAACEKIDEVAISVPETVELQVGKKVDWKDYVTVKINGEKVENPEITWKLTSGNENAGGICRYTIEFVHHGQTYSRDGVVRYTDVSIVVAEQTLKVGSPVDFAGKVTVKINGETRNPVISSVLKSGNPNEVGDCVYTISFTENGQTYTAEGVVHFRKAVVNVVVLSQNVEYGDNETDVEYISSQVQLAITVEGETVDSEITWKLGDNQVSEPDVNCKYIISFEHNGEKYEAEVSVLFQSPDVRFDVEIQHLNVGDDLDWNGHVKVSVNGQEIEHPEITWVKIRGDENQNGSCVYLISYEYKGETYTCEGTVRFAEPQVTINAIDQYLLVGGTIEWNEYVTVRIDGVVQKNPQLQVTLKSGTENAVGTCVYTLTFTYRDKPYSTEAKVVFVDSGMDPGDVDALDAILAKGVDDYTGYTMRYHFYEVGKEQYYISETDKVTLGAISNYYIDYTDVNFNDNVQQVVTNEMKYYLSVNGAANELCYYRDMGKETPEWKYTKFTIPNDEASYTRLLPMAFLFGDLESGITKAYFIKLDTNVYEVKEALLGEVAEKLFGYDEESDTYTRILLETDGYNITKITGYYTTDYDTADSQGNAVTVSVDSVVELSWSDFNDTAVEIPEATEYVPPREDLPEYVNPENGADLTSEQQNSLTEALNKVYQSITSGYTNDKGEMYYFYSGLLKLTGNLSYTEERELARYKDWIISDITTSYYCLKQTDTTCDVWMMISDKGDFIKYPGYEATLTDFATYFAITDFGFTADMFGFADGKYVVKPDKLDAVKEKISQVIPLSNFTNFELLTFTLKLDSSNNVTEWYMLADCTTVDKDVFYWQLTFNYSDFDVTEINLPDEIVGDLTDLDEARKEQVTEAFNADYSNATVTDCVNGSVMYYVGDKITVKGSVLNDAGYIEKFTDEYVIKDGNYFEILGGNETAITKAKFEEFVVCFNFGIIDVTKVKYDAVRDTYYIAAGDTDADAFALYYKGFFGDGANVNGFAFKIQDGRVVSVTVCFDNATATATLGDFGTTVVPVDKDNGTTEE